LLYNIVGACAENPAWFSLVVVVVVENIASMIEPCSFAGDLKGGEM